MKILFPYEDKFMKDSKCSDRVYGYILLHKATPFIANTQIAAALKVDRKTVGSKVKYLKEQGYLTYKDYCYEAPSVSLSYPIKEEILSKLICSFDKQENLVKIYIWLALCLRDHRPFHIGELAEALGYKKLKGTNRYHSRDTATIKGCLDMLSAAGMVELEVVPTSTQKGYPIDIYMVKAVKGED